MAKNTKRALPLIVGIYVFAACFVIMGLKYIFPETPLPLPIYAVSWRLIGGLIAVCRFFPAIALAGIMVPFGFIVLDVEPFPRFSPKFFAAIRSALITAIAVVALYGVLFFLAMPLAQNRRETLLFNGELFNQSKITSLQQIAEGKWLDAEKSINICRRIWPDSQEIAWLVEDIRINSTQVRLELAVENAAKLYNIKDLQPEDESKADTKPREPVNVAEAIAGAQEALKEKRYYDAHWLATLGTHLAKDNTPEYKQATRLAAEAWTKLGSLMPSDKETASYVLYRQKRDGYVAINDEDWIRAYHIFSDLIGKTPGDPDVVNFLALSKSKAQNLAFFLNERDYTHGEIINKPLYSLLAEAENTRVVLRFASISLFADAAYARNAEIISLNQDGSPGVRISAPYCKLRPQLTDTGARLLVMFRAIDQETQEQYNPTISGGDQNLFENAQLILALDYDNFRLLSKLKRGMNSLLIGDLFRAAHSFGNFGYVEQVFQAEILYQLSESASLLPIAVFVITLGWRFRSKKKLRYLGIPMLIILPFVFEAVIYFYRSILNTLCIWSVTSMGFTKSIVIFVCGTVVCFFCTLLILAGQREVS